MPITNGMKQSSCLTINQCSDAFQSAAFPFHSKCLMMERLLSVPLGIVLWSDGLEDHKVLMVIWSKFFFYLASPFHLPVFCLLSLLTFQFFSNLHPYNHSQ